MISRWLTLVFAALAIAGMSAAPALRAELPAAARLAGWEHHATGNSRAPVHRAPGLVDSALADPVHSQPVAGWPVSSARIAQLVSPALVDINSVVGNRGVSAAGTGIVLTPDGEVLTNNHVINGATSIRATDIGSGRTYQASVLGYDRGHDIAVLRLVGSSGLRTAKIGDSDSVRVGDQVAAVGNAGGAGGKPKAANGTVTALKRTISPRDELTGTSERLTGLIEVAANVEPGDSGGPLVNVAGEVIGVDTAASSNYHYSSAGGTGFAIPINSAVAIVRQIQERSATNGVHVGATGMLGVSVLSPAN